MRDDALRLELEQLLQALLEYVQTTDAPVEMAAVEVLVQLQAHRARVSREVPRAFNMAA